MYVDLIRAMYEDSCCFVVMALKMVRCQTGSMSKLVFGRAVSCKAFCLLWQWTG